MKLSEKFPPLYECSVCGCSVDVIPQGVGLEPVKKFSCEHTDAVIWANRKVTLRGVGRMEAMNGLQKAAIRLKLTLRQFLSIATGRSI